MSNWVNMIELAIFSQLARFDENFLKLWLQWSPSTNVHLIEYESGSQFKQARQGFCINQLYNKFVECEHW